LLWLGNDGQNAFLADEGVNLLEAWLNTGMAAPYVMASTSWTSGAPTPTPTPEPSETPVGTPTPTPDVTPTPTPTPVVDVEFWTDSLVTYRSGKRGQVVQTNVFKLQDTVLIKAHVTDGALDQTGAQVFMDVRDGSGTVVVSLQGFTDDAGIADLQWRIPRKQAAGGYTATVSNIIKSGYTYGGGGQASVAFTIQ
jgi:hypothetical protein